MYRFKKQSVLVSWVVVLLWMLLIFHMSSQVAEESDNLSKGVTKVVVETVEKVTPKSGLDVDSFNHIIRKNAHFFTYLVLGVLVLNAVIQSDIYGLKGIILALVICIMYAFSDEIHQLFVPGRGGQIRDVFIDSAGSIFGIGMYLIVSRIKRKVIIKFYIQM
ncbi:MAG: VanZ family protein [Firmicutes bacterium]|nr:VanZ family protein [Bacillota bacterium]